MSSLEQKFHSLFSPLPINEKARIVAFLSHLLAEETDENDSDFMEEDVETSRKVREMIDSGKMKLFSEEEFWAKLTSS